jgi:hypothetical protein
MAAAKLNDAATLEDVIKWLTTKERMALLNDRALISLLARLPTSATEAQTPAEVASEPDVAALALERRAG